MYKLKPSSRFLFFSLIFLFLLPLLTSSISADEDTDDLEDIQELIALDEQEEVNSLPTYENKDYDRKSEAEVLSKAQRIVLELNNDNTKPAIEENEYVLVLGYAPWCARSAELMPRFAEAANVLKGLGSTLSMAKIDADRYPKAASNLEIKGYPTLLLFVNGSSQPYTGGFSSDEIVIWARKKTGAPVIRINSVNEANEFLKKHSMFAVGLFDKFEGPDHEEFVKAAKADNEIQFVETSSEEIAKVLFPDVQSTKLFFGLVKSEPEQYTVFEGNFDGDRILQFLENNKFPLVTTLTEFNSAKVYSSPNKRQVYVFADADDLKKLLEPLQEIALRFKSKIMFIYVDIREENLAKPFLTLFGLEESDDIVIIAFDYNSGAKYLLESDPAPRHIEDFCTRLLDGSLSPHYKSQPVPDNKNATILTVVGKTFDELVLHSPKNILLEVHIPWCINCETTSKQMEKLAKHFEGLENLIFARIDASTNEHPHLQVEDYPTLLFYPASDKSNPINLPTKSSLKELAALINKHLKSQEPSTKDEL
ncbi:protein disulfide isomerase-like 1-6 [Olea europaea var. sylvestris]|uniref:protein disulfide isomerase-like 1-6 n=1 Tax=Olea europaea var. sylvestris TaxID=158386 RepID=UPI000C1CFA2D|nr:protein disulfide isomerase-like 1-6 [Olea europaea var. sylvestris]